MMPRRTFLKTTGSGMLLAAAALNGVDSGCATAPSGSPAPGGARASRRGNQVPYSAGRDLPTIAVPPGACDSHHHIYDPVAYPYDPKDSRNQPPATVDVYRLLQRRLGLTRNVIIQPSAYAYDNACTLAALEKMGGAARAVVVVDPKTTDAELSEMDRLGVRGIRFNIATGAANDPESISRLAQRVAPLGWSVHFWMGADVTVALEPLLAKLPSQIVFDHRGHLPQPDGIRHPAFKVICELLDKGRAWVKLSGLYQDSKAGEPGYADSLEVGKAFVKHAPERMVWGSDWPHPSLYSSYKPMPDDAAALSLLAVQAPDAATQRRILVDNPAVLFKF